ncbi:DEAD/DEAH box helicase [Prosthecobacter sp.]|uniref:DEAD/DEAH box helicase n=1 Tax=Prosthecobacter sp. TaxID=1965333 RepID=UPI0037850C9F
MIKCTNGLILFETPAGIIYPDAGEIYAVVHEGASLIRGHIVTETDFTSLGIEYSRFAAEPQIELLPSADSAHPEIQVRVLAREGEMIVPVPQLDEGFADYGCDGRFWTPLPSDTSEQVSKVVGQISRTATINLKQYLDCTGVRKHSITLLDRVPELLAESKAYPAPNISMPRDFAGTLYPYQASGFRWLAYMAGQGVPGCLLADEMGLGKTVQIICAFLACRERGMTQPVLIVAPATLLENWRREFRKFAPSVVPLIHRGADRAGIARLLETRDAIITSYDTMLSDISLFRSISWGLVILDEAQAIKNPDARRTQAIKSLNRIAAIAVTGTPVENRLTDLWSISDFLLPGRLGSRHEFERDFPETRDGAAMLEQRVTPFILRRRVAEVATDLPPRIDIPQAIDLDEKSAEAYERIRLSADPNSKGSALAVLQKLRLFCTHPWLVDELKDSTNATDCSTKLVRALEILEELFGNEEKALVFTSFLEMSDNLARTIARKFQVPVWQIDGRTDVPQRQEIVDKFSNTTGPAVLVLNPRAAGTGLNITAANHVIHFNLEWNPAIEDQASARAFRRGQTRPVTVHRLFYSGTVEEFIDARATTKRELAQESVVGSDGSDLDASEIIRALNLTPKSLI